jgi:Ca2+-binding RTX toxin-like protein
MITISIDNPIIIEGDSSSQLVFTVSLSEPVDATTILKYSTSNDTATSGQDYTSVTTKDITFNANDTVQTIVVPILDDNINELDETFLVNIYIPKGTTLNPSSKDILATTGIGTITDTSFANSNVTLNKVENIVLSGTDNLNATGNTLNNTLTGNSGNNILDGGSGNDTILGGIGNDSILGGSGHDSMSGEAGSDTLKGGADHDTYVIDKTDTIEEALNAGTDSVQANFDYALLDNFENLTLTGTGIKGTGNKLNNYLTGNKSNNTLDGLDGNDTIEGGIGSDTVSGGLGDDYYILAGVDVVKELADAGTDTVETNATYSLANQANLENVILTGVTNLNITGNDKDNILIGNEGNNAISSGVGNDVLDGKGGIDTLNGGTGNDSYIIDRLDDKITESANSGTDSVQTSFSYELKDDNLENITLTGKDPVEAIGNDLPNNITGNAGNNRLDGGAGSDTMSGGTGNDVFVVESIGDTVTENLNAGTDTVESKVDYILKDNTENLILTGNAVKGTGNNAKNILVGNDANNSLSGGNESDTLDGGSGNDNLNGGTGNDRYIVDGSDTVIETSTLSTEIDIVHSSVSYNLPDNVEELELLGTNNINGGGNSLKNKLIGNVGNNQLTGGDSNDSLDGSFGKDTLAGGLGDDYYVVDYFQDNVQENSDEGIDTVGTWITYNLKANCENLTLLGTSEINGNGNSANNIIIGNNGINILDASDGDDLLKAGGGNDTLISGVGNDSLNGESGADSLIGGMGDDIYSVDTSEDEIVEELNAGEETVYSSALSYTLSANLENLTLTGSTGNGTGNQLDNKITGASGANILDGGMGKDNMMGGTGNDTYIVDNIGDSVTENPSASSTTIELDTVMSAIDYTLGDNVENLNLTGYANLTGTGNKLDNRIIGNSGNNIIDGKEGNDLINAQAGNDSISGASGNDTLSGGMGSDTLVGQEGSDTYIVDNAGDKVTETAAATTTDPNLDTVLSGIDYSLGNNLENLTLLGTGNLNGTGNALNNSINGNSADNFLSGKAGDDLLNGGSGNDTLSGQEANDTLIGGTGADRFNYNTQKAFSGADLGSDRLLDFKSSESDKIILGKTTYGLQSSVGNGFSITTEFESVATDVAAKASKGIIAYSKETGNLFYNPNGVTLGGESILTTLANSSSLTLSGSDFVIEA